LGVRLPRRSSPTLDKSIGVKDGVWIVSSATGMRGAMMRDRTGAEQRRRVRLTACAVLSTLFLAMAAAGADTVPDWWAVDGPLKQPPDVFGTYTRGCVAGTQALPLDGPGHQVMRPSRDRFYGHPLLIRFLNDFSDRIRAAGHPGLLIGDLAQPRGGPMRSGHASHQLGLDADIWFLAAPNRRLSGEERETLSAVSLLDASGWAVDRRLWGDRPVALLRTASEAPEVSRIFVHPAIKQALCETVDGDREWLRKIRPWWGHHYHFHIRLGCPADASGCVDQAPAPPGDGCDASLAWWFSDEARQKAEAIARYSGPRRRITLAELPEACRAVLLAD
jgi:penicillin-insensitive murein DD-endopeptidase